LHIFRHIPSGISFYDSIYFTKITNFTVHVHFSDIGYRVAKISELRARSIIWPSIVILDRNNAFTFVAIDYVLPIEMVIPHFELILKSLVVDSPLSHFRTRNDQHTKSKHLYVV
jgi:hypothetical protein